jgi:steroid delta-isomerase-like uncharacterized protein
VKLNGIRKRTGTKAVILLTALSVCCAAGCAGTQREQELSAFQAGRERLEANKAIVLRAHEEVWSGGNLDVVDELYSEGYVSHWAYGDDSDREGLKKMLTEARTAFPDLREDVIHIVAEGDLVVTHFVSSGTFTGEMEGLQPSGQEVSRPEIAVHRLSNGLITEQWTVSDQLTLMRQLGLMN